MLTDKSDRHLGFSSSHQGCCICFEAIKQATPYTQRASVEFVRRML
ncbi:MAG: hypothetical protein V7K47_21265 [Nostoc sp.]